VFDRDSFKANAFNSAILKAKANGISTAWSNEAFELWYLLHFHNRVTAMSREQYRKAIEDSVNAKLGRSKSPFKYKKNDDEMFALLHKLGNENNAIKWAKQLAKHISNEQFANHNPQTMVYKLVQELNGQSEELNAELKVKFEQGL
jgi:ABC-type Fe3+-citrate transport system substrate-binding protein